MIKNNASDQIEGGLILIKNLQCFIVSEKVEKQKPFGVLIKEKFFRAPEKIQLELKVGGVTKRTTQSPVTASSDNTKKKAAWDEHIHFKVDSILSNNNHELVITCWNTSVKGLDGRLGEIRQDLSDFDKFDEPENKIKITLNEENPRIEIAFYLYYLSNNPPIKEMQNFEDFSIRNKQIGMILFNNISYRNILGHSGSLEFILQQQQVCYSMAEYWQINSIIYNSAQSQPQPKCEYPIAIPLIARPDKLIIRFKHGTKGCAETKMSIGPAGEMESTWPSLIKGGSVFAGEFPLMERGCTELKVTFDLSCHSIVTSRYIFKRKKPPPVPPRRSSTATKRSNNSVSIKDPKHKSIDYYNYGRSCDDPIQIQGGLNGPNPHIINRKHKSREFSHDTEELDTQGTSTINRKNQLREQYNNAEEFDHSIPIQGGRKHKSPSYDSEELQMYARTDSFASSISKSSSKNNIESYPRQENGLGIRPTRYEEESNSPSSSISQKHFVLANKKTPTAAIIMSNKNVSTHRNEHHVKIGCSPPLSPYVGAQDYDPIRQSIFDGYDEMNQSSDAEQTSPTASTASQPQDYVLIHSQPPQTHFTCPDGYELTSQPLKLKYNEIYMGRNIHNDDKVIVKLYKSHSRWENEVNFLKAIKSKMIVKVEYASPDNIEEQNYFIITRYFGRPLDEIAKDIHDYQLIKDILFNICKAVEWCHSKDVVHMDLNPSNIICKDKKIQRIQLCGFEYSKKVGEQLHSGLYDRPLSIGYTSPEIISLRNQHSSRLSVALSTSTYYTTPTTHSENLSVNYNSQHPYIENLLVDTSMDIFSLGCIFYYLNTKNILYTSEKALEKLSLTKICEDIEDEQVSILVKWMVNESSNERPDITRVLENSFFTGEKG